MSVRGAIVDGFASMPDAFRVDLPSESITGRGGDAQLTPRDAMVYFTTIQAIVGWADQGRTVTPPHTGALWRTLIADFNPHQDDLERESTSHRALPGFERCFQELMVWINDIVTVDPPIDVDNVTPADLNDLQIPFDASKYWIAMVAPNLGRRIARTTSGRLALIPQSSTMSDVLAVFQGVPVPFVLRKSEDGEYRVVGICYVDGLMDGEAMHGGRQLQDILLV